MPNCLFVNMESFVCAPKLDTFLNQDGDEHDEDDEDDEEQALKIAEPFFQIALKVRCMEEWWFYSFVP